MDIIQPFAKYVVDPVLALREKSSHRFWHNFLLKSQYWSKDELESWRLERLKKLLLHAYENCPFYTERFKTYGFDPKDFNAFDDLNNFPVLTKKDIQTNLETLTASNLNHKQMHLNRTGGSTGSPLEFYVDNDRQFSRRAATIRHDGWAGVDIGDKVAVLWGHRRDLSQSESTLFKIRKKIYDRRIFLDTSELNKENMSGFVKEINNYKPKTILAYANSLFLFARYIKEQKIQFSFRPQSIITSAELLSNEQRTVIEDVFETKVFNRYGCREVSVIASECSHHNGMHICAETLYLEFLKNNDNAQPGEDGKVIITDLLNTAMPLIRYQIEDVATPLEGACECGRTLPRLDIRGGRLTDFLITPEGNVISGASLTIYFIATVKGIMQAQLYQKKKEHLLIRIVKGSEFNDKSLSDIKENVAKFFGPDMKWDIESVDSIPLLPSGKYLFSICDLDPMEYLS